MDPKLLRTFIAVAELRHFARAAGLCNLSQPAVSHQIALLEAEVGARLLNRANRRVSLTVAGDVMLEEARRILGAIDRARERMKDVALGTTGRVRLGASPTAGYYLLPAVLASYRSDHPSFDLHFEIAPAHRLAARVARNDLDMAVLAGAPPASDLRSRPLAEDELMVVASANHRHARAKSVTAAQLGTERWVVREEGSETGRALSTWWHRHHLQPERTMAFDGPDGVKHAVRSGLGIALTSALTVRDELKAGMLVPLPVKGALPRRSFVLVDHPQKHHGAACRAMLDAITRRAGGGKASGT